MSVGDKNGDRESTWGEVALGDFRARNLRLFIWIGAIVVVLIVLFVVLSVAKGIWTDWLWFDNLGYKSVFTKILGLRIWLFFAGALPVAALLLINLYIAYRCSRGESVLAVPPEFLKLGRLGIIAGACLTTFIMSLVFGFVASGRWETFLVFFNRVSFGVTDPQFDKDMSFHVAVMPMLHFIQGWLMGLVIAILVAVIALYFVIFSLRGVRIVLTPRIRGHIAILGAFLMLTIAAAHYLDIFELVFSGRGAAPGAGYTDVNARLPILWLLVGISVVAAVGLAVSLKYGGMRLMIAAFSLWAVLAILAGAMYPAAFQRLRVKPNEFEREQTYVERAIEATRNAYDLNLVTETSFADYTPKLDPKTVANNPETIENIRLWDDRPLRATYNRIEAIQLFYNFVGVDVDRYRFPDGDYRQVMLSARELFPEDLPVEAQNWVNRKLAYTHGYGVAMSPVNRKDDQGLPEFFLEDVPPRGRLDVSRPEIYYGENTKDFVVINTDTEEFNFRGEDTEPFYSNYEGTGGVDVGSFFRRAAFAWRFVDFNLLISGQVSSDSKIQFRREIQDRVSAIVPFLRLDSDPYLVVGGEGKLWWIQDAYTTTDRYAYSARFQDDFNYIRNSVKVVIDAYNGTVHFFVIDPADPLIRIFRGAFPDLFRDFEEIDGLDASLREHIRYPLDLFAAQSEIYLRYHMQDSREFFENGDLWARSRELFFANTQDVEPYYIIMKLPGEEKEEFVLLLPFTPASTERQNMVGWMAARNDGEHYGKLVTFVFSGQVDGLELVESRITNDDTIRERLTLLCPSETVTCIRGNLLAIPLGDSLLYVEPLFIRPVATDFPQLKQVFVADGEKVVMADSLDEALTSLLGESIPVRVVTPPTDGEPVDDARLEEFRKEIGTVIEELRKSLTTLEGELSDTVTALEEALKKLEETAAGGSSE